jgi:hypothetical protein
VDDIALIILERTGVNLSCSSIEFFTVAIYLRPPFFGFLILACSFFSCSIFSSMKAIAKAFSLYGDNSDPGCVSPNHSFME